MLRAYKYRLYPTREQEAALQRAFGCARWSYNWALDQRNRHYAMTGKTLSTYDLNVMLTSVKKANPWLSEVSDWVLKEAVANCGTAFRRFFEGKASHPRFKSKRTARRSATYRRQRVEGDRVRLSKVGAVRFRRHREMPGEVRRLTVSQDPSGRYFVSFLVEDGAAAPPKASVPERGVGVDVGVKSFCALSDGAVVANPKPLAETQQRIARAQRALSRKHEGSARYERQRRKVAKLHERARNQRRDFQHKLSRRIVDENQVVAVEDLNVKGMMANRKLARAISDCGWSEFVAMLEYKCEWAGCELLRCGRFDASTRLCSACGAAAGPKGAAELDVREWSCPECGAVHDRDVNAARNILKLAVAGTVNGRGGDVRRADPRRYDLVLAHANSFEASSPGL